jgi:hypothetical protein
MTSILPSYTHIINPKLKHTYLSFDDEGTLVIKSPKVSQSYIESLLLQKSAWIRRTQEKLAAKKGSLKDIFQNDELYFLGSAYPLHLKEHSKKRTSFVFNQTDCTLYYHTFDTALFMKQIDRFYKSEAESLIPSLVEKWAQKMNLYPTKIKFRKTRRQWGSCSTKNVLSFNTMLMKLPLKVIEYVVVHELAHIQHKHHQKAFWKLVEQTMPDYKERVAKLHTYTPH